MNKSNKDNQLTGRCKRCNRVLRTPKAIQRGYGPRLLENTPIGDKTKRKRFI